MNYATSPVTREDNTSLIATIDSDKIKSLYSSIGVDVERFFTNDKNIEIRECNHTGYRYYYPFSIFGDARFYEELQSKSSEYYPQNKWEYKVAIDFITPNSSVLEIGCATGLFLDKCKLKNTINKGLEFNENAVKISVAKGYNVTTESLEEHALSNKNKYDFICSFQVLEHISDVNSYIINALDCLKPNGKLIIGVPNNNPYIYKHDMYHTLNLPPHHAGLWNKESMINMAAFFNLEVEYVKVSPIEEYKLWFLAQKNYYLEKRPILGSILSLIPRPIYKIVIQLFAKQIDGKTLLTVLKRK